MHDGVSKVWVMNREYGLDLSGFKTEIEAIDHLVRVALLKRFSKEQILEAVDKALKHLDERPPVCGECDTPLTDGKCLECLECAKDDVAP
jgi:hypothetical protein